MPLYVDEYDPTGVFAPPGTPVTSTLVSGSGKCSLSVGQVATAPSGPYFDHDREGWPQTSVNGQLVTWPCYRVGVGSQVAGE